MAANDTPRDRLRPDQILAQGFEAYSIPDLISDDDDDEVTRVMDVEESAADTTRNPTMIPPRVDDGDVYMLTKQRLRFKAGLVAPERVDLLDVMRAPSDLPPAMADRETLDDLSERDTITRVAPMRARSTPPSLAPIAMDAPVAAVAPRRPGVRAGVVSVGALAIAAIVAVLAPRSGRPNLPQPAHPQAAAQAAPQAEIVARGPVELALVEIVAPVPAAMATVADQARAAVVAPAAAPPALEQALADVPAVQPKANEEAPAPAAPELPAFDKDAASRALSGANRTAGTCREEGVPSFPYVVAVTFAPTGKVTNAMVQGAPYAGTPTGSCIARTFRGATIPAFSGSIVTVRKAFELP